jgi:Ca-activated chloride channel family protein
VEFAHSHLLSLLALVPVVGLMLLASLRRRRRLLERFGQWTQVERLTPRARRGIRSLRVVLWTAALALLVLTLARPKFGEVEETVLTQGVDIIVALDTSTSMLADDVHPSRLERARTQLADLVSRLRGHRVGIISFAGVAMLQCPLTLDQGILHQTLGIADQHAVGVQGTAIADAIRMAVSSYDEESSRHRVLILLTDGEDHIGDISAAAEEAREANVTIHAVGIGTSAGSSIPDFDQWGQETGFKRNEDGSPVLTRLDSVSLLQLSQATGGRAFETTRLGRVEIDAIAREILALPQREFEEQRIRRKEEQFQVFLFLAIVMLMVDQLLLTGRRRRRRVSVAPAPATAAALALALVVPCGQAQSAERENNAGVGLHRDGDLDGALEHYQRAQVEAPGSAPIALNIGTVFYEREDFEEAGRHWASAVNAPDPGYEAPAHFNLGTARIRQAQQVAAQDDLRGAIAHIEPGIEALRRSLLEDPIAQDAKTNLEMAIELRRQWNQRLNQQMEMPPQQQSQNQQQDQEQQSQQSAPSQGDQPQDQEQQQQDQGQDQSDSPTDQSQPDQSQEGQSEQEPQQPSQQASGTEPREQQTQEPDPNAMAPLSQDMSGEGESSPDGMTPEDQALDDQRESAEARLDALPFSEYPMGMRNLLGVRGRPPEGGPDW